MVRINSRTSVSKPLIPGLGKATDGRGDKADYEIRNGALRNQSMEQAIGAGGFGTGEVDPVADGEREVDPGYSVRQLKTFSPLLQFLILYLDAPSHRGRTLCRSGRTGTWS